MMVIEHDKLPTFGQTFSAAALQAVRMKAGKESEGTLPDTQARAKVTADRAVYADFAHLVGDSVATHLHPGYIHALGFPLTMSLLVRKDFPLPLLGMLHMTNRVTQTRGIEAGEEMEMIASIGNARPHYAGTLLDSVVTVLVDGEEVLVDTAGYLVRGSELGGPRPERPEREEFTPGIPTAQWKLGADAGQRYAKVSGDANPIHLNSLTSRPFGFKKPIIHGMYSASRAYSATGVGSNGPRDWFVEFEAPIALPGKVQFATSREGNRVSYEGWREGRGDKPARRHFNGYVERG
ncbi:acyl dehydratase [Flaviflexus ciconiae]|uniref:Acyl dehydratase n=1 Tax=Flaviflexus ciconiae TaxID=2496867 RepID=A0A3S9PZ05_9ACTO|nr:MaoC/PaaZ C-terminal domain-containing protein [Flaviflexus ciconiae]AZQ77589.1 acyl dehydratase [Flaviflexus ciconiae]